MKVAVGLPAYNEERNIAKIIVSLKKITDNIIVCDDGSSDLTGQISKQLGANVLTHERNLGYGASIRDIFIKARDLDCDALVTFDADGQHKVEDIEKLLEPISNGSSDIVIGSRFLNNNNEIPKYRKIGIKTITKVTNMSANTKLTDAQSGLRAYSKKVLKKIVPVENGMAVSTEILIKASKEGFKISEIPITVLYKGDTSTHNPVVHGFSVLMGTLRFNSIEHPLKFYGIPGFIFLIIGLIFVVWTIQGFSETRSIVTNIALISVGSTLLGVMLLITSMLLYSLVNVVRESQSK